jgi:hypothetical protein
MNTGVMNFNGLVMGNTMLSKRIIHLWCTITLVSVFGIGELLAEEVSFSQQRPPIQLRRISKHVSYPGVQGAPIVQEFYLWVEVSKKLQRSMKKQTWRIDFDSFHWSGYRGLGSYGSQGAEVKSMRISSPTNEWRYWKDRFAVDSAKQHWMLVVGTIEIPTRNEYDFIEAIRTLGDDQNSLSDSINAAGDGHDSVSDSSTVFRAGQNSNTSKLGVNTNDHQGGKNKYLLKHLSPSAGVASDNHRKAKNNRVPWESGDPELVVFYSILRWESIGFQKVSQSVIRVDKISRTTAVFHP